MPAQRRQIARRNTRPATTWARFVTVHTLVTEGTKVLLATFSLDNPGISEVIRRTRGMISVTSDVSANMEEQIGAFGMIVVNDLALAAGAASIPGPVTDANDDSWFVWKGIVQTNGATVGGIATGSTMPPYEYDSKAMRKVPQGFGIAVMYEGLAGGNGADVALAISLLSSRT